MGIVNFFSELNDRQKAFDLKDAAIHREKSPGGLGELNEDGSLRLTLAERLAGINKDGTGAGDIEGQIEGNKLGRKVKKIERENPTITFSPVARVGTDNDQTYNAKALASARVDIARQGLLDAGVPKSLITSDLNVTALNKLGEDFKTSKELTTKIENIDGGAALLAKAREAAGQEYLTPSALRSLMIEADTKSPSGVLKTKLEDLSVKGAEKDLKVADKGLEVSDENIRASKATTALNTLQAGNNFELSQYELNLKSAQLEQAAQQQQALLTHQALMANNSNKLQLSLAELSRDERRDERRIDREREDRDKRQALMLQLMSGLGNIGRNLGGAL